MRRTLMILILALPLSAGADPLFMKDSLKGREFFDPWGVGVDVFTMKQDYQLKKLEFDLPGVAPIDPEDPPDCGNAVVDPGEDCDEGAGNSDEPGATCRTDCTLARCGDGILDADEECDDGNNVDADGCQANCALPFCGDGIVDADEECDDGDENSESDSHRNFQLHRECYSDGDWHGDDEPQLDGHRNGAGLRCGGCHVRRRAMHQAGFGVRGGLL